MEAPLIHHFVVQVEHTPHHWMTVSPELYSIEDASVFARWWKSTYPLTSYSTSSLTSPRIVGISVVEYADEPEDETAVQP